MSASRGESFQSFVVFVTHACNLRCDYCYLAKQPCSMSAETGAQVADFVARHTAADAKELSVCFFGGEPLMVPRTVERLAESVLARARHDGRAAAFSMTTNGTLVDAGNAELLHRYNIRTKVSLDGIGEAHDRHRKFANGRGSFARIRRHLARIRGLPGITVRVTVSPNNVTSLAASARWLAEEGFPHVFFSPVVEAAWTPASLTELLDQTEALHRLAADYPETAFANLRRDAERLRAGPRRRHGCGAAVSMAAIDADGYLYPCHRYVGYFGDRLADYRIGSVYTGVDAAARRRFVDGGRIDRRRHCGLGLYAAETATEAQACASCRLLPVCHAACMAVNEAMTGYAQQPAPINRLLAQISAATCLVHTAAPVRPAAR